MTVYKYKTFKEAEQALWNFYPDKAYYKKVCELFDFADRLSPIRYPEGIFKYRTIEEAIKDRKKIEFEHTKSIQFKRLKTGFKGLIK